MALLEVLGPDHAAQHVKLDAAELLVGRDPAAGLRLKGTKVSRRHARFFWDKSAVWLEDLNSANGVSVNGERLRGPMLLQANAQVSIGDYTLTLLADVPVGAEAPKGVPDTHPDAAAEVVWVGQAAPIEGLRIVLPLGPFDVGRSAKYPVHLDDASVSRHHATGQVNPGQIALKDMGSRNGTFVNGEQITECTVAPGDTLRFGNLTFRVEQAAKAGIAPPVPAPSVQPSPAPEGAPAVLAPLPLPDVPSLGSIVSYTPPKSPPQRLPQKPWPILRWLTYAGMLGIVLLAILAGRHALDRRQERRYEGEMADGLTRAEALMRQGSWKRAQEAFVAVLYRDPLNAQAHKGRHQAELHLDYEAAMDTLTEPESATYSGQIFVRLSPLLSDPEAAVLGERPRTQLEQAKRQIAQNCALEALGACRTQAWARCRDQAVCAVVFDNDNMLGAALLDQAVEFVPVPPLNKGTPAEASKRRAVLAARYPQVGVRAAVLTYATGDLTGAMRLLRHIPGSGALTALGTLVELAKAQKVGDAALARGNSAVAIHAFEQAVALDAKLLPPGQPSVLGRSLLERGTNQWLREGERAFNRGRYSDALTAWQRGLQLDPNHRGLLRSVGRLESRAQQIFDAAARSTHATAEVCSQLREVQSMVRRDQPLYQATLDKLAACPNNSP